MRYVRCFMTAVLACVVVAGCSDPERTSRRRMAEQIDKARRLYNHATTLLVNPQYIDRTTGRRSPIQRKLPAGGVDVPTTRPVGDPRITKLLEDAARLLTGALSDNPDAPVGAKADAHHLLGQIQLAKGRYHCATAERVRGKVVTLRLRTHMLLAMAESNIILGAFSRSLANLPREKINDLRSKTTKRLADLDTEITTIDRKIASMEAENANLLKANESLLAQARSLRDRGEVTGGPKGLELFKKAQGLEARVNDNASKVAANQQAVEVFKFDGVRLRQDRRETDLKLAAVTKHLQRMDARGAGAMATAKAADRRALEGRQKAETLAGQIVECCEDLAGREKLAVAALEEAAVRLDQAEKAIRTEIAAGRAAALQQDSTSEIIEGLIDDQHLALVIAMKGSAGLALGDLRGRQIETAKSNTALAEAIAKAPKALGQDPPAVVKLLKEGYLADPNKTRALAEENYTNAETALGVIQKSHLKKGIARNTAWICQAQLANAYLGHYRLTGQRVVLDKARQFVAEALAEKADSPYLKRVVELQKLIQTAGR